jgi:hypothetical protein
MPKRNLYRFSQINTERACVLIQDGRRQAVIGVPLLFVWLPLFERVRFVVSFFHHPYFHLSVIIVKKPKGFL